MATPVCLDCISNREVDEAQRPSSLILAVVKKVMCFPISDTFTNTSLIHFSYLDVHDATILSDEVNRNFTIETSPRRSHPSTTNVSSPVPNAATSRGTS